MKFGTHMPCRGTAPICSFMASTQNDAPFWVPEIREGRLIIRTRKRGPNVEKSPYGFKMSWEVDVVPLQHPSRTQGGGPSSLSFFSGFGFPCKPLSTQKGRPFFF